MEVNPSRPTTAAIISPQFRWVAIGVFLSGLALDTATTTTLITLPGYAEMNPLVDFAIAVGGPLGMVAIKLALPGLAALVFRHLYEGPERAWVLNMLLTTCGILWAGAGVWNLSLVL